MKKLSLLVALVAGIALLGWVFRLQLLLALIVPLQNLTDPIGPKREVSWEAGPGASLLPPAERPPNIVLFLVDDMGFNDISFYGGGPGIDTPNINAIAEQGIHFSNGYSGSAVCAISRAGLMTGRYSTRFGFEFTPTPSLMKPVTRMISDSAGPPLHRALYNEEALASEMAYEDQGMPAAEITIAELLKQRAYRTGHIGKWHLGLKTEFKPEHQGFDESLLMRTTLHARADDPEVVAARLDFDPIDRFLWAAGRFGASFNDGELFEPDRYLADYYTDEAIEFIEANRNRPFFLYLSHWGIHTPLQATREDYEALAHIEDHNKRVYAAMTLAIDRSVGRVTEALRKYDLEDNTLFIFTSDNGGAHYIGMADVNKPYRGFKLTLFEGGTHIPFFMKWPARIAAGSHSVEPVIHYDIFSTAAAAAGADLPADRPIDGIDLLPHIGDLPQDKVTSPARQLVWREGFYQAILRDGWKLQVSDKPKKDWLYHLAEDPTEQDNLADRYPDKVAALKTRLAAHNAEQLEPMWPSIVQLPVTIDKPLNVPVTDEDEYIYWPN